MRLTISPFYYSGFVRQGWKLIAFLLLVSSGLAQAQVNQSINQGPFLIGKNVESPYTSSGNLKTAATATCPVNPVAMSASDTSGNVVTNGQNLGCSPIPFVISPAAPITTAPNAPCIETVFTNYHNNLSTNGTESFYQNGVNIGCLGPNGSGCSFPIGDPGSNNAGVVNSPWAISLYVIDPGKSHEFTFCRSGNITANTVNLVDCWTGIALPSTPISTVFSTATTTITPKACDTLRLAANTDIGTALYSIAPASGTVALINNNDGTAFIKANILPAGTYTVTYNFDPSLASLCNTVSGTFKFTIAPSPTVTASNVSICPGATATVTASGATTYTWSPATGLSNTTGATVTSTTSVTTTYTVTGTISGCVASDTARVTINATTFTVNPATVCTGDSVNLIASNSAYSYTWSPATGLNTTTNDTVKASPSVAIVYTITATNGAGCVSKPVFDSIKVNISPTITAFSPTVCVGTTATITATGATSYTWVPSTN